MNNFMYENTIIKKGINLNNSNIDYFKDVIFSNYLGLEEPETKDPYRKHLLERERQREEKLKEFETDKVFFDKLSDDFKMIRLRGGKDKEKQREDLLNFVC